MEWHTPNGLMLYDGEYQEDLKHGTGWRAMVLIHLHRQVRLAGWANVQRRVEGQIEYEARLPRGLQDGQRSGPGTEIA